MKREVFRSVTLAMVALWLVGIASAGYSAPAAQSINLITTPAGMGMYTIAVAQAQLISKKTGLQVIVQPSQGPKVIPFILESGDGQAATLSTLSCRCPDPSLSPGACDEISTQK